MQRQEAEYLFNFSMHKKFREGMIILSNQDSITQIKLNSLGIGRFSFLAENTKKYKVVFTINDEKIEKNFAKTIAENGICTVKI